MTHCEMLFFQKCYKNSHGLLVEENFFFSLLAWKAEIHSFPTMYIIGGVRLVEMGQNSDFLKKKCLKNSISKDTILDHLTLEG